MKKAATMEIVLILSLILAAGAKGARAGSLCLEEAAGKLKPDKEIILVGYDTTSIQGRLVKIDLNRSAVTISRMINNDIIDTTVAVDNIARVKYRHARLRPGYMVLGTFAAPVVVGIVGGIAGWSLGSGWDAMGRGIAIAFGSMGAGLVLGTVLPLIFPGHDTIHCDD